MDDNICGVVSCDIVAHSLSSVEVQGQRVQAINTIIGNIMNRNPVVMYRAMKSGFSDGVTEVGNLGEGTIPLCAGVLNTHIHLDSECNHIIPRVKV